MTITLSSCSLNSLEGTGLSHGCAIVVLLNFDSFIRNVFQGLSPVSRYCWWFEEIVIWIIHVLIILRILMVFVATGWKFSIMFFLLIWFCSVYKVVNKPNSNEPNRNSVLFLFFFKVVRVRLKLIYYWGYSFELGSFIFESVQTRLVFGSYLVHLN